MSNKVTKILTHSSLVLPVSVILLPGLMIDNFSANRLLKIRSQLSRYWRKSHKWIP